MFNLLYLPVFLISIHQSVEDFTFPEVKFEAFTPKGLRVSIPDIEGTTSLTFRGTAVHFPKFVERDEIEGNIHAPIGKRWTFFDANVTLRIGDTLFSSVEIYNGGQFHLKENLPWRVTELKTLENSCELSYSEWLEKKNFCRGDEIFLDNFATPDLDKTKWKQVHLIPSEPDFEFCSYQTDGDTCFVSNGVLKFRPKLLTDEPDVRGILDLRDRCTSNLESECIVKQEGGFILPPVISSRIILLKPFKYGAIEMRAKLPCGDWLYPEIYLQSAYSTRKKIWIAYSRGNTFFTCSGVDVGGSRLFGGPSLDTTEPERSKLLSSTKSRKQFCNAYHKYSIVWEKDRLTLVVDDLMYGTYYSNITNSFNDPMYLILGVGVGGLTDFPDNCVGQKGTHKPWSNTERLMFKKFYSSRDAWFPTWSNSSTMDIDYVKISAV